MQIIEKRLDELTPYENNPRKNENAVPYVAESIKRYGFKQPIVVDTDGVIVAGHTRYAAAIELGLESVPCVVADDLTEEEIAEYRLVDNKVAEFSGWDFAALEEELSSLDFDRTDFGFTEATDINIDDLFEEHDEEPKDPKTVTCPHCGEVIEI
jgi:site-specific DNA-methyltransferase (adenine-specific)